MSNLNSHMRLHSPDNSNVCAVCQKPFLNAAYLTKHLKVHLMGKTRENRSQVELPRKEEYLRAHCEGKATSNTSGDKLSKNNQHFVQNRVKNQLKLSTGKRAGLGKFKTKWATQEKKVFSCTLCRSSFMLHNTLKKHMMVNHPSGS